MGVGGNNHINTFLIQYSIPKKIDIPAKYNTETEPQNSKIKLRYKAQIQGWVIKLKSKVKLQSSKSKSSYKARS